MAISEENRLTNYIINLFRNTSSLKRALIEPRIQLIQKKKKTNGDIESKPDLLCYLNQKNSNLYQIYEYKHRTKFYEDDVDKFTSQYSKYKKINHSHLDRAVIQIDVSANFGINYIFHNTPSSIVDQYINANIFEESTEIDYYNVENSVRLIQRKNESSDEINSNFINQLVENSENTDLWESKIVPFIPRDLRGITGLSGSSDNVSINLRTSIDIILADLFNFILHRKIQELSGEFNISDFFEFLYSNLLNTLEVFTKGDRKNIEKKLILFFDYLIKIADQEEKVILKKSENKMGNYSIRVKNTNTLHKRLNELQECMYILIDSERKQRKIDEYLKDQ
ncbi:MAG: hypothetical protein JW870_11050 [Candidatus Delongbacteria bacterium]|nr:hypothetical protein [Candidatus Delongbacteria bacterium]